MRSGKWNLLNRIDLVTVRGVTFISRGILRGGINSESDGYAYTRCIVFYFSANGYTKHNVYIRGTGPECSTGTALSRTWKDRRLSRRR